MPYLQVDLDGKRKWPLVAKGCNITEAQVAKGFLDLWETCWREKSARVSLMYLECLFESPGRGERIAEVLCAFGFLEKTGDGYRVSGADRYLRITEARSLGGKKAAANGNLKKGKNPGKRSSSSRKAAGEQLETTPSSGPALTPITEHQSPNTEQTTSPPQAASEPGWQALVKELFDVFRGDRGKDPEPSGRDWNALKKLRERTKQGDREIAVRWGRGLRAQFKQRVDSFQDLNDKWDSLASGDPPKRAGNARFFAAQDADPKAFERTGVVNDF